MENLNYNRRINALNNAQGTTCNDYYYQEDASSIEEKRDITENYSMFSLYLQENTAGLFCTYGDISTYIKEAEDLFFTPEGDVMYMNITYKKGLHILKSMGYEKESSRFLPFDVRTDDDYETPKAIYYEENWRRIS